MCVCINTARHYVTTENNSKNLNLTVQTYGICSETESAMENETDKILCDFEIQTDCLNSARRPDLVIVNKKRKKKRMNRIMDFDVRLTTK